ncbi:MauE/DoxX family redox-associated membrane protein [Chitinophaga sp. S165]|uniref:MauE/DoxX family redox-associated membrane protein n=1 Tax=Chitinophaga sp. S165 TaxID=2135462 RepID=UPI000D712928|nr:MauE/DoxX family redox-associated membrane protein [Chitinophaga sp. S165]
MKREQIVFVIAVLLQVLFFYAAVSKVSDMEKFRTEIGQSPLLTYFVPVIAIGVPVFEIAIVGLLYFERTRLLGLYLSLFLMAAFTAYVIAIMRFASHVPCSCGGILSNMNWKQHLGFNIAFTGLALAGILLVENYTKKELNKKGKANNLNVGIFYNP